MSTKEVQVRRRDAYNRVGLTVEKNPATDNVRISREVPAPERIADNHHRRRNTLLLRSREPAPQVRLDPEHLKETRGDAHSPNSFRVARTIQISRVLQWGVHSLDRLDRCHFLAPVLVVCCFAALSTHRNNGFTVRAEN